MPKYTLGDVSKEVKETFKGDKTGKPIVGLEHLTPSEVTLSAWDLDTDNTFTKSFESGDMLFGRRRAYLKKAAMAPFDGICSGDITVIRANPERLSPDLLPFLIQNDYLFDYAVEKSAGSLSPRVKWEHLKAYSLLLPDLEEQQKTAEVLWAIEETCQSYKKLMAETDELIRSQFIEMFGDQKTNPKGLPFLTLGEVCSFYSGTGFPNKYQGETTGTYPFYKVGDISRNVLNGNKWLQEADNYVEPAIVEKIRGTVVPPGTVVFAKIGEALRLNRRAITSQESLIDNNAMGIRPLDALDLEYFFYFMQQLDLGELAGTTAMPSVRKSALEGLHIVVPSIDEQRKFARLSMQSDRAKQALQQSLNEARALQKKIVEDNFIVQRKEDE